MLHPPRHRSFRKLVSVAAVPSLLLGLAACGSSTKASSSATTAAAAVTTAAPAATAAPTTAAPATTAAAAATTAAGGGAAAGTPVAVVESEYKIDIPQTSLTAGTYTFNVANTGQYKHNLAIKGGDVDVKSDAFAGGQAGTLTVTLKPGTYDVYCAIPTHKGKGMDLTITVT